MLCFLGPDDESYSLLGIPQAMPFPISITRHEVPFLSHIRQLTKLEPLNFGTSVELGYVPAHIHPCKNEIAVLVSTAVS